MLIEQKQYNYSNVAFLTKINVLKSIMIRKYKTSTRKTLLKLPSYCLIFLYAEIK